MEPLGSDGNGKKRILVLEDSPIMLDIYHFLLDDKYEIEVVDNCNEGLRLAGANGICGVIADIFLRGSATGLDFLACCDKKVPVIVVTAYGETYREQAQKLGAKDYIPKPFNNDQLISSVVQHFG